MSLLWKVLVACAAAAFLYILYLHHCHMATVNLLDLADFLEFIASAAWVGRLVSQASVNWFYDTFTILHRWLLLLELFMCVWTLLGYSYLWFSGVRRFEMSENAPLKYGPIFALFPLAVLLLQLRVYPARPLGYGARELPL
ncbi:hypothetical protein METBISCDRAFT_24304 [Metschnikowia bicuspidata]|uniref:Uncharacterized protein n=1 Tax=Metschnikowia bicuspidata TaxID=27322 RepID=A0A4P9Z9F3_9ASCO|nr:hypothetical protein METBISCDRAFT_24304 [Metschnikowia bicuspidata]